MIMAMYSLNNAVVKWGNDISKSFFMSNGVKQGGVLSANLFSLYIDNLLNDLSTSDYGCRMGNNNLNCFSYADDIVLLAPTLTSLKSMIKMYNDFSVKF